jgi:ABC-type polysaccharide/polyol phosphate transport system ATPase subunit
MRANKMELFLKNYKDHSGNMINGINTKEEHQNNDLEIRETSLELNDVGLCYKRTGQFSLWKNKNLRKERKHWALKHITFKVYKGDCVGIIGRNGSGKSTLSMICAGVLSPDRGNVIKNGRSRLLSLGLGFKPDCTGRMNINISASIIGLSRKEIKKKMPEIEEFAELGDFIDEPVRTYSAGMRSRLGFAIATSVVPEILILDEVMSTGDASFRKKAEARMKNMLAEAGTVIMVSHSPDSVKSLCNRVLWIEKSRLIMDGDPESIVDAYLKFSENPNKWLNLHPEIFKMINQQKISS